MNNLIIKNFLRRFKENFELYDDNEDILFKKFINYCVINNHIIDSERNFHKIDTENAKAIDGIAILVNNKLVINEEDLNELIKNNSVLSVDFIFVQSKSSPHFSDPEIGYFFKNIKKFISEEKCSINELYRFRLIFRHNYLSDALEHFFWNLCEVLQKRNNRFSQLLSSGMKSIGNHTLFQSSSNPFDQI